MSVFIRPFRFAGSCVSRIPARIIFLTALSGIIPNFSDFARADVTIQGVSDFHFGSWSGSGPMTMTGNVCVWSTVGIRPYAVQVRHLKGGSRFDISDSRQPLPYTVRFRGTSGGFVEVSPLQAQIFSDTSPLPQCGGGTNAQIQIEFQTRDLSAAISGFYSSPLIIEVREQ